jgi:hypothetical protein
MMNENQLREYIELQRQLIALLWSGRGHTMEEIKAMQRLEDFENALPCNQEES